jgi:16S rRNA (guanine(966)-N(2))-methyltransferase RsmD
MRLISGAAHGRRFRAPRGFETRPATARVRASIFSRIGSRYNIQDSHILDIYAGSGSLGLEALSRGAAYCVFIDSSRTAAATIERNLQQLALTARAKVLRLDVGRALPLLGASSEKFDLIFIDPPFTEDCSAEVLAKVTHLDLLKPHGIAIVRQFHRAPELVVPELERLSVANVGDHRIAFYRRPEPPS